MSWTVEGKIRAIAEAPLRCFVPHPSTVMISEPRLEHMVTPDFPDGVVNEVGRFVYEAHEADQEIDRLLDMYRSRGLPFKWVVGPGSAPPDLPDRLERRGLMWWWVRGMAADVRTLTLDAPGDVTVERVGDEMLDEYCAACAEGFGVPLAHVRRHMDRQRQSPASPHISFLARIAGVPVGTGAVGELGDHAYFTAASALPRHRGRGVYRALVAARLAYCRDRGISLAVTQAREATSAPILERLGFETVYRFQMFASPDAAPRASV